MLQPNVPKKLVSFIKVWVSMLLIVATVIASFTPLITLKIKDENGGMGSTITELVQEIDGAEGLEFPDEVSVSMPKLVSGVGVIFKLVGTIMDSAKDASEGNTEAAGEGLSSIEELLNTPEGKETLIIMLAFASTVMNVFDFEDMSDNILGMIAKLFVTFIALMYVLAFTFIVPIVITIMAIIAAIKAIKNLKTPEEASAKVGGMLPSLLKFSLIYLLLQSFIPGMSLAAGSTLIFVFAVCSVILSAVCARLRKYTDQDCKYSLIAQGASVVGLIGYLMYFFSIVKTNVFQNFISGEWARVFGVVMINQAASSTALDVPSGHIVTAILMVISVILIFASSFYFSKLATRLALSMKSKKGSPSDVAFVMPILILLTYILPAIVMGQTYDYSKIGQSNEVCFLALTAAEKSAMATALVGAIIILIAEIGLIVMKKVFVPNVSKDDVVNVITGKALSPEEKIEQAQNVINELENEASATEVAE